MTKQLAVVGIVVLMAVLTICVSLKYNWTPEISVCVAPIVCGYVGYEMGRKDSKCPVETIAPTT